MLHCQYNLYGNRNLSGSPFDDGGYANAKQTREGAIADTQFAMQPDKGARVIFRVQSRSAPL